MSKILISTGMRVGSTWIGRMVCDILKTATVPAFIKSKDSTVSLAHHVDFLNTHSNRNIFKSHEIMPDKYEELHSLVPDLKIINIIRNEEDALYSRFKYAKYHKPCDYIRSIIGDDFFLENDEHSINLLIKEDTILSSWTKELRDFSIEYNNSFILTLHYEKLVNHDKSEFDRLFKFLEVSPSLHFLEYFISKHSFENYQKNEKNKHIQRKDSELFYRSGKIGEGFRKF
jgi:hypothetical protein